MTKLPQNMSSRYVRALLTEGKNDLFELVKIEQRISSVENIPVGIYFIVTISRPAQDHASASAIGATPVAALQNVLKSFGVTFR